MSDLYRLQFVYRHLPDSSLEARVLGYLMNRDAITANRAKERVAEALAAWLGIDLLSHEPSLLLQSDCKRQLRNSIAALESRAAYCRRVLEEMEQESREESPADEGFSQPFPDIGLGHPSLGESDGDDELFGPSANFAGKMQ